MKKQITILILSVLAYTGYAQEKTGVNTTSPKATLDIVSATANTTTDVEGILIPRVSKEKAFKMIGVEEATEIYINDLSTSFAFPTDGTEAKVAKITENGFYYWNGTLWIKSDKQEPWQVVGTTNQASANTEDVYQNGKVAVGFSNSDSFTTLGTAQSNVFEVKGGDAVINGVAVGRGNSSVSSNIAIGNGALNKNTSGEYNVAIGIGALNESTTVSQITAIGYRALYSNNTGVHNTAIGYRAMTLNTTGNNNTALGYEALIRNTEGGNNTAVGSAALNENRTGIQNAALGNSALRENTTGNHNTALGSSALANLKEGSSNVGVGAKALYNNVSGSHNTAVGYGALSSKTLTSDNTAVGYSAMSGGNNGNGGERNTAIGVGTLYKNEGDDNLAIGSNSLQNNTTGDNNVAVGSSCMFGNISGADNIALGYLALRFNTAGNNNIALGYKALYNATSNNNVALGYRALINTSTGFNNIGIGYNVEVPDNNGSNQLNIGNTLYGLNIGQANSKVGIGTTSPTEKLEVAGSIKMVDGSQGAGKVLTSDANGKASWQTIDPDVQVSLVNTQLGTGVTIDNANKNQWLDTGTTITLPPGKWLVSGTLVFSVNILNGGTNQGGVWVRATFCDSPTDIDYSSDITSNSKLISGGLAWGVTYGTMVGSMIIHNQTSANKTYYLKTNGDIILPSNDVQVFKFGGTENVENMIKGERLE